MCGILAIFNASSLNAVELRKKCLRCAKLLRHRGPDWSGIYIYPDENQEKAIKTNSNGKALKPSAAMAHERLSIIDPNSGAQPLFSNDKKLVLCVNGEIYNHMKIRENEDFATYHTFKTQSDCEVIIPLYKKYKEECPKYLDGMFSFVIWDEENEEFFAARDHMGITPLYIGWRSDGGVVFSSELKGLQAICDSFELFPPGHSFSSKDKDSKTGETKFKKWYSPIWADGTMKFLENNESNFTFETVRKNFEKAVVKRMMSDVPWGVLLSGGLDSSLVCSVACRYAATTIKSYPKIHTFSVGIDGSPDIKAAKLVADFLGTEHHSLSYTIQEGLDALYDVIYHLETYDVTTIRSSTPMYLMARKIKALGVKMVLSGEGADEALGGYLYFHKAPNREEFQKETVSKLSFLHYFDCLRANKAMSAFGVEPRVPFLDKEFLDYAMTINPEHKMCKVRPGDEKRGSIEKYMLRKAFDTPENPYLPEEVLWRQKEQFSDGVGYGWIDSLRDKAESEVSDMQFSTRAKKFPINTPTTKEAYYYRNIFEKHFPSESAKSSVMGGPSVACSTPAAIEWDAAFKKLASAVGGDNSGRAITGVHNNAYDDVTAVVSGQVSRKKQKLS